MCIDFDGHHSGGSSFVYVNDFCYYRNCLYTHRYKFSFEKKKKKQVKSPNIWSRSPDSVRIRQSGRTGNRGVTIPLSGHSPAKASLFQCSFCQIPTRR